MVRCIPFFFLPPPPPPSSSTCARMSQIFFPPSEHPPKHLGRSFLTYALLTVLCTWKFLFFLSQELRWSLHTIPSITLVGTWIRNRAAGIHWDWSSTMRHQCHAKRRLDQLSHKIPSSSHAELQQVCFLLSETIFWFFSNLPTLFYGISVMYFYLMSCLCHYLY